MSRATGYRKFRTHGDDDERVGLSLSSMLFRNQREMAYRRPTTLPCRLHNRAKVEDVGKLELPTGLRYRQQR